MLLDNPAFPFVHCLFILEHSFGLFPLPFLSIIFSCSWTCGHHPSQEQILTSRYPLPLATPHFLPLFRGKPCPPFISNNHPSNLSRACSKLNCLLHSAEILSLIKMMSWLGLTLLPLHCRVHGSASILTSRTTIVWLPHPALDSPLHPHCLSVCMDICMYVHVYAHMPVETTGQLQLAFLGCYDLSFLVTVSPASLDFIKQDRLAAQQGPVVQLSDSLVLRLKAHTLPSSPFALGSWSSNLGSCDFKANISLTELSSQDQSHSVFSPRSLNTGRLYTSVFEPLPFSYFHSPSCELQFHTSITASLP